MHPHPPFSQLRMLSCLESHHTPGEDPVMVWMVCLLLVGHQWSLHNFVGGMCVAGGEDKERGDNVEG